MAPRLAFCIPPAVFDRRLKGQCLRVLLYLGMHASTKTGWCRVSQVMMAKKLGCGRATVQAAIAWLIAARYVERRVERHANGADASHSYRVRFDITEADLEAMDEGARAASEADFDGDEGGAGGEGEETAEMLASGGIAPPAGQPAPPAGQPAPITKKILTISPLTPLSGGSMRIVDRDWRKRGEASCLAKPRPASTRLSRPSTRVTR